jgi:hypothetical protein
MRRCLLRTFGKQKIQEVVEEKLTKTELQEAVTKLMLTVGA